MTAEEREPHVILAAMRDAARQQDWARVALEVGRVCGAKGVELKKILRGAADAADDVGLCDPQPSKVAVRRQHYKRREQLFAGRGVEGYHSFRIPAIVHAGSGVLIAFAEGRVNSERDWGNIKLVAKRSVDNGASWSPLEVLAGADDDDVWGNPTALFERPWAGCPRGRVHLFLNFTDGRFSAFNQIRHGDRRTMHTYSDDAGESWAPLRDLTETLLPQDMAWDAVGPGAGIQKQRDPDKGLLVVPARHRNFHSSDHGMTWNYVRLAQTGQAGTTDEATVAECVTGELFRNDRGRTEPKRRWTTYGLHSFPVPTPQENLVDPFCEGSMLRYSFGQTPHDRIIFLNSDSETVRRRMLVRVSYDSGRTWPMNRLLYTEPTSEGKGGYSSLAKTSDYCVACLCEQNPAFGRGTSMSIDFHKFNLPWIFDGREEPSPSCV